MKLLNFVLLVCFLIALAGVAGAQVCSPVPKEIADFPHPAFNDAMVAQKTFLGHKPSLTEVEGLLTMEAQNEVAAARKLLTSATIDEIRASFKQAKAKQAQQVANPAIDCNLAALNYYNGCTGGGGDEFFCFVAAEAFRCFCENPNSSACVANSDVATGPPVGAFVGHFTVMDSNGQTTQIRAFKVFGGCVCACATEPGGICTGSTSQDAPGCSPGGGDARSTGTPGSELYICNYNCCEASRQ